MAGYKLPCIACGGFIDFDSKTCPLCGRRSPFADRCPSCLCEVKKQWLKCPSCARALSIACPHCKKPTFVGDACQSCGKSLLVRCGNKRCLAVQFFENTSCNECGRKLKDKTFVE